MGVQNLSGRVLGQYELRELLGAGGMGAVYLAYQRTLERQVAVKILNVTLITDPDYVARFYREAKTSAALEHPHIVPIYDYATQDGISYVVMRLLTGGSLAERLAYSLSHQRPLPGLTETAVIVRQLANALDYAHSRGVVHRDVKTNNVMFDEQGTSFLVDFGIAKLMHATSALTGTGMTVGTPSYMAPEQWRGDDVQPSADQYSLAVLTYHTLTGRMPFEAETPYALMHKHLNEEPTPLTVFRADLPDAVRGVLNRALSKDPNQRYPTVTAFAEAFQQAAQGSTEGSAASHFFVTPLPKRNLLPDLPTVSDQVITPDRPVTPSPRQETEIVKDPAARNRLSLGWLLIGVILALLIGLAGLWVFDPLNLIRESGTLVGLPPTNTLDSRSAAQRTREAIFTQTATQWTITPTPDVDATLNAELTALFALDLTQTATQWTSTPTASLTISPTPTAIPSETATLDVRNAAQATRAAFLTLTATLWTATPSPDVTRMIGAELTALFEQDLTMTATLWTPTATHTATPTDRPTRTSTFTRTPTSTITPSATPEPLAQCPNTRPNRLYPGGQGFVLSDDTRSVNVRAGAGLDNPILDRIPINTQFVVLEGPECNGDFAWYQIEYMGDRQGWIAESDSEIYFIAPYLLHPGTGDTLLTTCAMLRGDDFELGTQNDWFFNSTDTYEIAVRDGAYLMQIYPRAEGSSLDPQGEGNPVLWGSLREFEFENGSVEAILSADPFNVRSGTITGLWLRFQGDNYYLAFMLRGDGRYRIARYSVEQGYEDLVGWTRSAAINTGDGAFNTLRIDLDGHRADVFVNGVYLASPIDDTWERGRLAFWGASRQTPATFSLDYLRVCRL
ncbi:MAG: serine/threonine protein kinase [Anaerolineae bacterium]|nr:serine/threonine protein kinase [Anaerolineae bacterium]